MTHITTSQLSLKGILAFFVKNNAKRPYNDDGTFQLPKNELETNVAMVPNGVFLAYCYHLGPYCYYYYY